MLLFHALPTDQSAHAESLFFSAHVLIWKKMHEQGKINTEFKLVSDIFTVSYAIQH